MAAKVNKTVVIALVAGVVCVVAGVMFLMTFVLRSGSDLALQGDRLMEAGKHDEAASAYSKAVNKDRNNIEYIQKWGKALSSQTPTSLQAYSDRYRAWLSTQRLIANVKRVDPAAHRAVLDMVLSDARISPRAGPVWQMLESDSSDIIARMKDEPQEKIDQIRRYRGIATVGKMGQSLEVSTEDRARAKDDLLTAMGADATDALAAVYYADLMRLSSEKLRAGINEEDADATLAEGLAAMQAFCDKHPTSTVARLGLLQLEIADLTAKARKNPSATTEYQAQIKPKMEALLATLESEDPANVDEFVATQVLDTVVREKITDAVERGAKIFERIVAAKPDKPFARLMMARFNATTDAPRKAADEFKKIMDLPNQPVSPTGLSLFGVRDSAAIQRVDSLIALTERQKTPADRAAALTETKAARDELRARSTVDDAPKTLIDAKIALLSNDSAEARKLLGQYHQSTSYSDAAALMLSARVLYTQGLKGEAKTMLVRILDRRMGNAEVFKMLCQIDSELNNLPSALNWSEQGLSIAPNDPMLISMKEQLENSIRNVGNTDPLQRTLAEMKNAILLAPPDLEVVKAKGLVAIPLCTKPEHFVEVARMMRRVGREEGLGATNRGLEKFPTDPTLLAMSKRFMITDPLKEELERLDGDPNLSPLEKEIGRYFALGQSGKTAEAMQALERAAAIDPEHPLIVAGLFEQALAGGKLDRAAELAQKAKEKNLDKADGRIYAARLAEAHGRFTDAIPLLERASEIDRLNPLTWRYLGNAYLAVNDRAKALAAFSRSLQIKPDDILTINSHIQCLMSMDRTTEALSAAREASRMGISHPGFLQLWLLLEFRVGDRDLALDRRAFILRTDPSNIDNALEYAKCLIEVRRLTEARQVMDAVENAANTPELTKALQLPLGMMKAALRG
ncbi:MAG: tetratricopeptide repeat protein, partial [Phycisphaerales bacterium]|nr:tetratricopeptide repeat protein [Phycisphaerales bacterium]